MTPTPETPSLSELRRLRDAATQENWQHDVTHAEIFGNVTRAVIAVCEPIPLGRCIERRNAEFIAYAANHAVQIAESLERENAELRECLNNLMQYMGSTCDENEVPNGVSIEEGHTESKRFTAAYWVAVDLLAKHKEK